MATFTSSWRNYGSGGRWRLILEITDPPAVGTGTSSVSLTARLRIQTSPGTLFDSSNTNTISGDLGTSSGSANVSHSSTSGGTTTVRTRTASVSTTYGSSKRVDVTGTISGYEAFGGGTYSISGHVTIPARPYSAPNTPGSPGVSRISDTQQRVTWTRRATTAAPWTGVRVERWSQTTGSWALRANVTGSNATSYTDSTAANNRYRYRMRAYGPGGTSGWVYTNYIHTTPAAPNNVAISEVSNGIRVTWGNPSNFGTSFEISRRVNGGSWSGVYATVTGTSYTDTAVSVGNAYSYRVRRRANSDGVNLVSAYVEAPGSITPIEPPDPPISPAVARVSDTQQTITWTRQVSAARPWDGVRIERSSEDSPAWVHLTNVTGTGTSFTDSTTQSNRRYTYRIRAYNAQGTSTYVTAGTISTTPAAPTGVTAVKTAAADIRVAWVDAAGFAGARFDIEHSAGGGPWEPLVSDVAGSPYLHLAPDPNETHTYRVRAVETRQSPDLPGPWSQPSNTVQLLAPPLAPTPLFPVGEVLDVSEGPVTVSWQHNPVDTTEQSRFEWELRVAGGSVLHSDDQMGDASSALVPDGLLSNGNAYEWRVRTWGAYPDPSPWSDWTPFTTSTRPTVAISLPTDPHVTSTVRVQWAYFDAEGTPQSGWRVWLYGGGGTLLETHEGVSGDFVDLTTLVNDGRTYEVAVQVRDGDGLWSNVERREFLVNYALPPQPQVEAVMDVDTLSVNVYITNPPTGDGEVEAVHNNVYRYQGDGRFLVLAENVPLNSSVIDPLPRYGPDAVNLYVVQAVSATPSIRLSEVEAVRHPAGGCEAWFALNAGPGYAHLARFRGDPVVAISYAREKVLRHFIGRRNPVEYSTANRTRTITLSGSLEGLPGNDDAAFMALEDFPPPIVYRDGRGRRIFTSIGEMAFTDQPYPYQQVSTTLTEIDHLEGVEVAIPVGTSVEEDGTGLFAFTTYTGDASVSFRLVGTGLYEAVADGGRESLLRVGRGLYEVIRW